MNSKLIDARGQLCPQPLILAKQAINDANISGEFLLLIDNETSKENVERFLMDNHMLFETKKEGDCFQLIVSKSGENINNKIDEYCHISPEKKSDQNHIIVIKNDKMGAGADELGVILIKGFINTIKAVSPLPQKIIFYNNGVKLTLKDSPVIESLKELEKKGIKILVCGTCTDYFNIKDKIGCGTISNMYDIVDSLIHSSLIVTP